MTRSRRAAQPGKVRAARLTDLAALGRAVAPVPVGRRRHALARAAGQRPADRRVQPVPPAARCLPAARPACTSTRRTAGSPGLVRVEREAVRDEWTIVELDAVGHGRCRRHPLPPRPAAAARGREARRRPLPRRLRRRRRQRRAVHAGRLRPLRRGAHPVPRPATSRCRRRGRDERAAGGRHPAGHAARRARPRRACTPPSTPAPVAAPRGASASPTGSARGRTGASRARASTPILRFADVEGVRPGVAGRRPGRDRSSTASSRSASRRRTSRTTSRSSPARRPTSSALVDFGLGVIAGPDATGRRPRRDHGVIAPVRTYESPIDRRLEEAGFESIATRHAADEGNPRPRRRAGPRAGRVR